MAFKILLAFYLVVAVAMIFFILMQRGAGAQAGSGFGSGASGTVFGASGAGNFLSISTKWLAVAFFGISIGMGVYVSHSSMRGPSTDLGVMSEAPKADAATDVPAAATDVPAAATPAQGEPAATSDVPVAVDAATAPAAPGADGVTPVVEAAKVEAGNVESETAVEQPEKK
jgi:preprotein translocase subunit SecG